MNPAVIVTSLATPSEIETNANVSLVVGTADDEGDLRTGTLGTSAPDEGASAESSGDGSDRKIGKVFKGTNKKASPREPVLDIGMKQITKTRQKLFRSYTHDGFSITKSLLTIHWRGSNYIAAMVVSIVSLTACSGGYYNPLDDYRQLEPATVLATPDASPAIYPVELVDKGRYLVGLLGCGSCHTDGALVGAPVPGRALAGSSIGIAYSNPLATARPGVLFASNLTPDTETGIGDRSLADLVRMIRLGVNEHGSQTIPVMPWPAYANILEDDARAIAMYLKSLAPVHHQVPDNVRPGQRTSATFVHFGVYQSRN